jgi:hypothetical protein
LPEAVDGHDLAISAITADSDHWVTQGAAPFLGENVQPLEFVAAMGQLRVVAVAAEHRNYSLAARALGLSQPGVHRTVTDFQRLCGATLFRASASGLESVAAASGAARCMALALSEIDKKL